MAFLHGKVTKALGIGNFGLWLFNLSVNVSVSVNNLIKNSILIVKLGSFLLFFGMQILIWVFYFYFF